MAVFVSFTGRAEAAPENVVSTSVSPATYRPLCDAGTPVDFAVSPSNVNFNLTTGVLSYNINLQWKRCTGGNTRAYAIYSQGPEICPYSGTYGVGGWTTDCVKYIGSPAYVGPGNGLTCWGGTNSQCITPVFSGVRRVENQPSYGINSVSIPMSTSNSLWAFAPDNGTWTVTQRMCQYYKTGVNFGLNNDNRCVDVSISVTWSGSTQYSFDITLNGQATLNDDENPSSVKYDNVGAKSNYAVNNVKLTRKYIIKRAGSPDIDILPPANPNSQTVNIGTGFYYMDPNPDTRALSGLQAGDQVCVVVTASPGSGKGKSDGTVTTAGIDKQETFCDSFVNKPYVSYYGNDVLVGGDFQGGDCSKISDIQTFYSTVTNAGSAVQLAAMVNGQISQFVSASQRTLSPLKPKGLTFSNSSISDAYGGNFGNSKCIEDYWSKSPAPTTAIGANTLNLSTLSSGTYLYRPSSGSSLELTSANVNSQITLYIDGDTTIVGDLTLANSSSWSSTSSIPRLTIISRGNINIFKDVQLLEGAFIAQPSPSPNSGNIITCTRLDGSNYLFGNSELFTECNKQLTIFGSFTAKKVALLRTYRSLRNGVDKEPGSLSSAAEVFRFSPEQYIAPLAPSSRQEDTEYDYYTSLPPIL